MSKGQTIPIAICYLQIKEAAEGGSRPNLKSDLIFLSNKQCVKQNYNRNYMELYLNNIKQQYQTIVYINLQKQYGYLSIYILNIKYIIYT